MMYNLLLICRKVAHTMTTDVETVNASGKLINLSQACSLSNSLPDIELKRLSTNNELYCYYYYIYILII